MRFPLRARTSMLPSSPEVTGADCPAGMLAVAKQRDCEAAARTLGMTFVPAPETLEATGGGLDYVPRLVLLRPRG